MTDIKLPLAAVSTAGTEVFLLITRAVALFIYTYTHHYQHIRLVTAGYMSLCLSVNRQSYVMYPQHYVPPYFLFCSSCYFRVFIHLCTMRLT